LERDRGAEVVVGQEGAERLVVDVGVDRHDPPVSRRRARGSSYRWMMRPMTRGLIDSLWTPYQNKIRTFIEVPSPMSRLADLAALRRQIAAVEQGGRRAAPGLSLDGAGLDAAFQHGGLPLGCWHALGGEGMEAETAAAPAAFAAKI